MNIFEGKTIIMGVPKLFKLDSLIDDELRAVGFKTINISVHNNTFRYKNVLQRIENFIAKRILKKRNYKQYLNFKQARNSILKTLQPVHDADFILIIRPEVYPFNFLKELKKKGKKMIGYQWNGLSRYPHTRQYIPLFDQFYVFDSADLKEPSVLPLTNFFPTTIQATVNEMDKSDVFYVGSFYSNRMAALCDILSKCEALGLHVRYHIYSKRTKKSVPCGLTVTKAMLSYQQNIQYTYNTKVLLDLKIDEHEGLSFRVLESVGLSKKLITTNSRVRDYDFFHPDNILIWDGQSKEELESFIEKPYVFLSEHIKNKYSFKNWIQYVLGVGSYTPITLPE
jgi:hypothetical protein